MRINIGVNDEDELEDNGRVAKGQIILNEQSTKRGYNLTVYCFSPVWDSPTEWVNISKTVEVHGNSNNFLFRQLY